MGAVLRGLSKCWRGLGGWLGGLLGVLAAGSFWVTGQVVPPPVGVAPAGLSALLVGLGGCRGVAAEVLWWRIGQLQEEERFAEMVPLMELLVVLEPSSEEAWVYHGWNLAYNVSSAHRSAAERWQWVLQGIQLLEEGLRVVPASQRLMRELGWIWESKIGGDLDSAGAYYRFRCGEVPAPADGAAFERALGVGVDWRRPQMRALYWYWRAEAGEARVRVLASLVRAGEGEVWLPLLLRELRGGVWEAMGEPRQAGMGRFLSAARGHFPALAGEIEAFLREVQCDSNNW